MSEPSYIHVRNWDRFQHHKNREVPWIKDYGRQLSDDGYRDLTFHQRGILHGLRLEYLRTQARGIRDTTATVSRRLGQRVVTRDLKALSDAGFITFSSRQILEPVYDRIEQSREDPPIVPPRKTKEKKEPVTSLDQERVRRQRPPDELWDAMVLAFQADEFTDSSRGVMNRAVGELRKAGALPSQVGERKQTYERRFPDAPCTPTALVKHWPYLNGGPAVPTTAAARYALERQRREQA